MRPSDKGPKPTTPLHEASTTATSSPVGRQRQAVYRSPPPLPRLDTASPSISRCISQSPPPHLGLRTNATPVSRSPDRQKRSTVYATTREFYPTPLTVTDRLRYAAMYEGRQPQSDRSAAYPTPPPPHTQYGKSQVHSYYDAYDPYAIAPPPSHAYPTSVHRPSGYAHHPDPAYAVLRPRLQIHPYAAPPPHVDARYHTAAAGPAPQMLAVGVNRSYASPASAISPEGFKAPRKRADDTQLAILNDVFERTAYPSTEEREELARRLGMTSRSVQIWFQNRRRAVKVEQQSAQQRMEADVRGVEGRTRGLQGQPFLSESGGGGKYSVNPVVSPSRSTGHIRSQSMGQLHVPAEMRQHLAPNAAVVKREQPSPERKF